MSLCGVCNTNPHKYRCPGCKTLRYCSKECFKIHKDDGCGVTPSQEKAPEPQPQTQRRTEDEEEHQPRISFGHLKLLAASPDVTTPLHSARLRELIRTIDSAANPQAMLEKHIESNPEFAQFVDAILVAIGARDPTPVVKPPTLLDRVKELLDSSAQ